MLLLSRWLYEQYFICVGYMQVVYCCSFDRSPACSAFYEQAGEGRRAISRNTACCSLLHFFITFKMYHPPDTKLVLERGIQLRPELLTQFHFNI